MQNAHPAQAHARNYKTSNILLQLDCYSWGRARRIPSNTCSGKLKVVLDVIALLIRATIFNSHLQIRWIGCLDLSSRIKKSFFTRRLDFFSRILHFRAYHASRHRAVLFKFHVFKCHSRPVKINELRNETLIFYFLSFPPPETTKFFTLVRRCNEWWCKISGLRQYTWPTVSTTTSRLRWPRSW